MKLALIDVTELTTNQLASLRRNLDDSLRWVEGEIGEVRVIEGSKEDFEWLMDNDVVGDGRRVGNYRRSLLREAMGGGDDSLQLANEAIKSLDEVKGTIAKLFKADSIKLDCTDLGEVGGTLEGRSSWEAEGGWEGY